MEKLFSWYLNINILWKLEVAGILWFEYLRCHTWVTPGCVFTLVSAPHNLLERAVRLSMSDAHLLNARLTPQRGVGCSACLGVLQMLLRCSHMNRGRVLSVLTWWRDFPHRCRPRDNYMRIVTPLSKATSQDRAFSKNNLHLIVTAVKLWIRVTFLILGTDGCKSAYAKFCHIQFLQFFVGWLFHPSPPFLW